MPIYEGTLLDLIQKNNTFSEYEIHSIANYILNGLQDLFERNLVHRDIKPSNVFLAPNHEGEGNYYLIGDMESGDFLKMGISHISGGTGTFAHLAPEQILEFRSTSATDIWSLGCLLHWLYSGKKEPKIMYSASIKPDYIKVLKEELKGKNFSDLIIRMLSIAEKERPTALECLS